MTFLLLTGAGFSYNWGGPLASEVFNAILADKDIDEHTRGLLFASRGAFETVLVDLQVSKDPNDQNRHDALIDSVAGIFNGNTFMHTQFEFEDTHLNRRAQHIAEHATLGQQKTQVPQAR